MCVKDLETNKELTCVSASVGLRVCVCMCVKWGRRSTVGQLEVSGPMSQLPAAHWISLSLWPTELFLASHIHPPSTKRAYAHTQCMYTIKPIDTHSYTNNQAPWIPASYKLIEIIVCQTKKEIETDKRVDKEIERK